MSETFLVVARLLVLEGAGNSRRLMPRERHTHRTFARKLRPRCGFRLIYQLLRIPSRGLSFGFLFQ